LDLAAWVNIASGLLVAALGAGLLAADPRRDWNRVFALFAILWGAQIVSANAVRLAPDAATARLAGEVTLAFLVPLYFFLAAFAGIFPRPRPPFGTSVGAIALLALPAAAALVVLFAAPTLLVASVTPQPGGGFGLRWGPALPLLVTGPFFGAVFYALHAMTQRLAEAHGPTERRQVALVLAALAIYAGHVTPFEFLRFASSALGLAPPPEAGVAEAAVIAAIMGLGLLLLARLAIVLVRMPLQSTAALRDRQVVLAALGVGVGSAALLALVEVAGGPGLELLGLLRTGSVALIVYGIVRYQLFDIDVRVKDVGPAVAALLAAVAIAAAAWLALPPGVITGAAPFVVALAGLAAFLPLARAFARLADRVAPGVSREGDHLYLRKLEVYRAAVEATLAEGRDAPPSHPSLAEQRRRLGLTERDHGIVVSLAATRAEPAKAAPDLRPGGVVFGKYAVDSLLAEGGFGRVFLARDRLLGRSVVIKELQAKWRGDPAMVRTFLREAQLAGQLAHPHLVGVLAVEQHGQDHYVVMEHCPGGTLAERLAGGKRLPPKEACRIAAEVLEGLEAAHGKGIVHRDVKPENILFGARGEAKVGDFGIAQLGEGDAQRTIGALTSAGFQPGTLQYMSPEHARGVAVDHRSDLYAVGAVLHRMLTGQPHVALDGLDELAARNAIVAAAPPALTGVPAPLRGAVRKALAVKPEDRFANAAQFRAALQPEAAAKAPADPSGIGEGTPAGAASR
jgi:hypothetical protein